MALFSYLNQANTFSKSISRDSWQSPAFTALLGVFLGYKNSPNRKYPQMLSIQEVKNAKAGDKARKFYDRDGLYLFVTPAGGKYWRGKYRVNGREKTLSLGT
ncbi:MAG: Arm DNA-binding domain-containing protein [Sedimenticolaceae bacterium]